MLLHNLADIKGKIRFWQGDWASPSVTSNKKIDCDWHLGGPKSSLNCWDLG